jgi:hypothetical protein
VWTAVVVGVVAVAGAAVGAGWLWLDRGPLAGELHHDFGLVLIERNKATVHHTFSLHNRSDHSVVIARATPSCKCTVGKPSRGTVAPGETVELEASLSLSASGLRETHIDLLLECGEKTLTQRLELSAVGRRKQWLWSRMPVMEIHPGQTLRFRDAVAEVFEGERPPPVPTLEVPPGFEAAFEGWDLIGAGVPSRHRPAVWRPRIAVTMQVAELPPQAAMRILLPPDQVLEVELTDRSLSAVLRDAMMNPDRDEDEEDGGH